MKIYFIKQTVREITKNKFFFLINTLGLTLGIIIFFVISFWIHTELSYDKFHENSGSIFRVDYLLHEDGVLEQHSAAAVPVIGPMLQQTFPEVEMYTRFHKTEGVVRYKDIFFKESEMFFAQSSFFSLFTFPLVDGTTLDNPLGVNKAVITESAAKRYFGTNNPLGKIIEVNGTEKYEITAIAKDLPITSHLHFEILLSYENLINRSQFFDTGWFLGQFYTYIQLAPGVSPKQLEQKIPELVLTHLGDFMQQADFLAEFKFTPLTDIHLHSRLDNEIKANGSMLRVQALGLIALVILLVAFTNYIILNTSRSADKSKKVALYKAMGAKKNQLIGWLLFETGIIITVVVLLSLLTIYYFTSAFEIFLGSYIRLSLPFLILLVSLVVSASILIAGFLPSISVLQAAPSSIRQGKKILHSKTGNLFRSFLILFQFTASIALIAGTIILSRQMNHLTNHNPGFNADRILVVEAPKAFGSMDEFLQKFEAFRNEMIRIPHVKQVSASSSVPGEDVRFRPVYGRAPLSDEPQLHSTNLGKIVQMVMVDQWYLETYELTLLAGRNFSSNTNLNPHEVIINYSALAYMGFNSPEEAVGARLTSERGDALVIGVINDYNQRSLYHATSPMVLANQPTNFYFSINFDGNHVQPILATIENQWDDFFPGNPLSYNFLNSSFFKEHITDKQFGRLLTLFTLIAIFISCLGLIGLSSYNTTLRTKEIGIRKANGAKMFDILLLLNKDLVKWVIIAFILATPLAWIGMNRWLQNFAYRTELSWWIFVLAGLLALGIALLTVSWQSWRAARRNPVEALRYE